MNYPGRIIKVGETDAAVVKAVQIQLTTLGCGPLPVNGIFEEKTKGSVKLFQTRNVDHDGIPLLQDGKIGKLTWEALFGPDLVTIPLIAT